jgi:hypothetical protein
MPKTTGTHRRRANLFGIHFPPRDDGATLKAYVEVWVIRTTDRNETIQHALSPFGPVRHATHLA